MMSTTQLPPEQPPQSPVLPGPAPQKPKRHWLRWLGLGLVVLVGSTWVDLRLRAVIDSEELDLRVGQDHGVGVVFVNAAVGPGHVRVERDGLWLAADVLLADYGYAVLAVLRQAEPARAVAV